MGQRADGCTVTWTRLSDDFADRHDVLQLSDTAFRVHVQALVHCNRLLTDGQLPTRALHLLIAPEVDHDAVIEELVSSGLWTRTKTGYALDWSDQERADTVRQRKETTAEKQRLYRERKSRHDSGDHAVCLAPYCKSAARAKEGRSTDKTVTTKGSPSTRGKGSTSTDKTVTSKGSRDDNTEGPRPDPSPSRDRPLGRAQGQGTGGAPFGATPQAAPRLVAPTGTGNTSPRGATFTPLVVPRKDGKGA